MIEKKSFQFCCFNKIRKLLSLRVKVSYSWGLKFLFEKCNLNICETKMFYAMHIEGKYFNLDIPDILKSWLYSWRDYIWRHKMDWRRLVRHFFWIYFSISCSFNDFLLVDKKCRAKFCILDDISRRIGLVNVVQLW